MESPEFLSGISRLFRGREILGQSVELEQEDGFSVPSRFLLTMSEMLAEYRAILITSRPWMGKTVVSEQLENHLIRMREKLGHPENFGEYIKRTPFEQYSPRDPILPEWWDPWQKGHDRACWIIDALEEGHNREPNICDHLMNKLRELNTTALKRLHLVMFAREAELPPGVKEGLDSLFGKEFLFAELLPLNKKNAISVVGGEEKLNHAIEIIKRCSLEDVAGIPAALRFISQQPKGADLSEIDVWRGVLKQLLKEHNKRRLERFTTELEHRFRAAIHIAVVITFANIIELRDENTNYRTPTVEDLISADQIPGGPNRQSAREAIKTMMFSRTSNGYRFAQKNIQEWMCTFGLENIPLGKLKPLITDERGALVPQYKEIISLLFKTTKQNEVQQWLIEQSGGILASSDSSKWSLTETVRVLDHLEKVASKSPWMLYLFKNQHYELFATPGIGSVLKERINDSTKPKTVRVLLIDIAKNIRAKEIVPIVANILKDQKEDEYLRRSAAAAICSLGTDEQLQTLKDFVENSRPKSRVEKDSISAIILELLQRNQWTVLQAYNYVPETDDDIIDRTDLLYSQLKRLMTLDDAQQIILKGLPQLSSRRKRKSQFLNLHRKGKTSILFHAIELLLKQDTPRDNDLKILIPLADKFEKNSGFLQLMNDFSIAVSKSTKYRRYLYELGVQRKSQRSKRTWISHFILRHGDLGWLRDHSLQFAEKDESIWDDLLRLAYSQETSHRERLNIRKFVRQHKPEIIKEFDKNRKKYLHWQRRELEKQKLQEKKRIQYSISESVQQVLENNKLDLKQRMWQLSWICFSDKYSKPENVSGQWEDLSEELQIKVLDICSRALKECKATPVPDGKTYPVSILYEASCFRSVLLFQPGSLQLSDMLIRRWLSSVLVFSIDQQNEVIDICSEADRCSTEDVTLDFIRRDMRSGSEHLVIAHNLQEKHWSDRVAESTASLIQDTNYNQKSRAELLRILTKNSARHAQPIIEEILKIQEDHTNVPSDLWKAALDCLLVTNEEKALPILREDYENRGVQALIEAESLYERHWGPKVQVLDWTSDKLLDLVRMLFDSLPPPDKIPSSGFVTPKMELRHLRDKVVQRIIEYNDEAIKILMEEQPSVRKLYLYNKAQRQIQEILKPKPLPLRKVVHLLDDANYRIIRNDNDLLEVLTEELSKIEKDSAKHLPMLYKPAERGRNAKRRHEEALQVYIHCRLYDRLPGKILDLETQVKYRRRLDIRVIAPTVQNGKATVVIEVKWSDNEEMSVGLSDQLGDNYLMQEALTHGIYLVGWNGKIYWKKRAGIHPKPKKCPTELQQRLEEQAQRYSGTQKNIKIIPIVFDLRWNPN